jgi:hypothetical protein
MDLSEPTRRELPTNSGGRFDRVGLVIIEAALSVIHSAAADSYGVPLRELQRNICLAERPLQTVHGHTRRCKAHSLEICASQRSKDHLPAEGASE